MWYGNMIFIYIYAYLYIWYTSIYTCPYTYTHTHTIYRYPISILNLTKYIHNVYLIYRPQPTVPPRSRPSSQALRRERNQRCKNAVATGLEEQRGDGIGASAGIGLPLSPPRLDVWIPGHVWVVNKSRFVYVGIFNWFVLVDLGFFFSWLYLIIRFEMECHS